MSKFSTTAELVEPATQQIFAKQKSARLKTWILAVSTALAVLGTAPFAQAAIVKGTINGTWNDYAEGALNLGDSFTATYSYDDTAVVPYDYSGTTGSDVSHTGFNVGLSSLRVISGSYDHTFDFLTPGAGSGSFHFQDYALTPPHTPYSQRVAQVYATDTIGSEYNSFHASRQPGQNNGIPFLYEFAEASTYDNSTDTYDRYAATYSNVNFSPDPTAVPTPALLPGLAAFGLGVWRKRKQAKQVEV